MTSHLLPQAGNVSFIRQQEPRGLGHAVWCARHLIGDDPFAVVLADDMVLADTPCLKQMVGAYNKSGGNVLGVMDIPRDKTGSYGIVDINISAQTNNKRLVKAKGLVEKPAPDKAPSTLSIIGRYILQPKVLDMLAKQKPGAGGEIQLTDAISDMIGKEDVFGYRFEGTRYDCGGLVGFVAANVAYALAREEIRERMVTELNAVFERSGVER
jgi:UTP--glucose-1-phosphate uridylyltransferase